jgi:unsaturated rhamnogalacturonyl hydrolase
MWLDGIYMGMPFYAEFAATFNEPDIFDDVVTQVSLITKQTRDVVTGLHYHGWDEKKEQFWANRETGCSPSFWGRATGWFTMALVDLLDFIPENHRGRGRITAIFSDLINALVKVQDGKTRLWYQVLDQGQRPGNYLEASASCMFIYAIAKGVRKGYLNKSLLDTVKKAYAGAIKHLLAIDDDGTLNLKGTCQTAGLGDRPNRDGTFAYYISEPVVDNDFKGIAAFILASTEMEKLVSPPNTLT